MATHYITLSVRVAMHEMDGTAEESAEIAQNLISENVDSDADIIVTYFGDSVDSSPFPRSAPVNF